MSSLKISFFLFIYRAFVFYSSRTKKTELLFLGFLVQKQIDFYFTEFINKKT